MLHISYLYRIYTVTFLPFRAYNTDNQLIIHSLLLIIFSFENFNSIKVRLELGFMKNATKTLKISIP